MVLSCLARWCRPGRLEEGAARAGSLGEEGFGLTLMRRKGHLGQGDNDTGEESHVEPEALGPGEKCYSHWSLDVWSPCW